MLCMLAIPVLPAKARLNYRAIKIKGLPWLYTSFFHIQHPGEISYKSTDRFIYVK
jgi:hypothetical protein